jgi:hypothetical protein
MVSLIVLGLEKWETKHHYYLRPLNGREFTVVCGEKFYHYIYVLCYFQHLFETIPECKNAVDESIRKQEDHHKKIMQLRNSTDRLKKIQHLATTRIEKLRPFEVHIRVDTFL